LATDASASGAIMTAYEAQILENIREHGTTTGELTKLIKMYGGTSRAANSSLLMHSLKRLEKRGYVKRMDDKTPICWMLKEQDK
jgi:DNA-binding HxlR family transcriptional regulator